MNEHECIYKPDVVLIRQPRNKSWYIMVVIDMDNVFFETSLCATINYCPFCGEKLEVTKNE